MTDKSLRPNGLLKCPPEQQQTWIHPWNFLGNESKIHYDGVVWDLEVLTASKFTLSAFMFRTTTVRITYRR